MRREAVDSESIASMGYAPNKCALEIEFRESGEVYRYFGVPPEEHAEFMAAPSKGNYLNQVFKAKGHRYMVVMQGRK